MTPEAAQRKSWDAIVIGTGMGGGLVGRRLAEQGLSVLFVEKGPLGQRREQQGINNVSMPDPLARHIRGFWQKPAQATVDGARQDFFAPVGSAVGGTSIFYSGALERPERHDIDSAPDLPHPTDGWPVSYDGFRPYFEQAEALLYIAGGPDPLSQDASTNLRPPLPVSAGEESLVEDLTQRGLHPYRQHLAIRNLSGCQFCFGIKCPRPCKMDGRSAGVEPALETGSAALLAETEVLTLEYDAVQVTGVRVRTGAQTYNLHAKYYVLAAGAFSSPRLLLSSNSPNPEGCANSSDWVGRGLMFHLNELFAVWPPRAKRFTGATKAVSLRDLYTYKGNRLGLIQSMGLEASYGNIAQYLAGVYDRSPLRRFRKLRRLTNIVALIAARILGEAKVFVGIMEDFAYPENRVTLHPDDPEIITFSYTISTELKERRVLFRRRIKKLFRGYRTMLLGRTPELNFGHPSGTLRFGDDPKTSVLDKDCKTHDLNNLYVADASFMPSSMGVNPSLTIAANALRVADIIAKRASE